MDRGHDNGSYYGDQGGGLPNFSNSCIFPLNSPSWYTPTPQLAPPNSFVWNQSHQNSTNHDETLFPSNVFSAFSSSSGAIGTSSHVGAGVPIIPSLPMDQRLGVDNMFLDGGQCVTLDDLRNYPNIDFTNQVINPSSQISDSGSNNSRTCTKRLWTAEEDSKLNALVSEFGTKNWTQISDLMGGRAGKQCRERWYNNLRPDIKLDVWTEEEERVLIEAHERMGNKWSQIAKLLPGRTENSIKNHWNAATRKKTMRLNRNKRYEPGNARPKSTLLRDYIRGMSSTSTSTTKKSTTSTTNSNVTIGKFTPNEVPSSSSFSSDSPSIGLIPTFDDEFEFMTNLISTTSIEPTVQAIEPQSQTNINPQGYNGNADNGTSFSSVILEDSFDMHTFSNSKDPIFGYGDMDMDLAFNAQGGGFSSL
ncbi:putative transcription factor MYB-HB-like family [Helianthus debilis subsp. tardiflorus]